MRWSFQFESYKSRCNCLKQIISEITSIPNPVKSNCFKSESEFKNSNRKWSFCVFQFVWSLHSPVWPLVIQPKPMVSSMNWRGGHCRIWQTGFSKKKWWTCRMSRRVQEDTVAHHKMTNVSRAASRWTATDRGLMWQRRRRPGCGRARTDKAHCMDRPITINISADQPVVNDLTMEPGWCSDIDSKT